MRTRQWYLLERAYARVPVEWMGRHKITMNFDDMIPMCVYDASAPSPSSGQQVGVNTGVMNAYMKLSIIEELTGKEMGKTARDAKDNWREYATAMEWATTKEELAQSLQQFHVLREYAVSPPWAPVPTVGDHTGEHYLVRPFAEVQQRLEQSNYFSPLSTPLSRSNTVGGEWLSSKDTKVRIVDTLFTTSSERGNLNNARGVMLGASSPIYDTSTSKMWFFSVKLRSEGAGHFMKKWLLHEATQLEARNTWANELGLLGVLALLTHELCASALLLTSPFLQVQEALGGLRNTTMRLSTLPYERLMDMFPIAIPKEKELLMGSLVLRAMKAVSLHADVPTVGMPTRQLMLSPMLAKICACETEDEDEESNECERASTPPPAQLPEGGQGAPPQPAKKRHGKTKKKK